MWRAGSSCVMGLPSAWSLACACLMQDVLSCLTFPGRQNPHHAPTAGGNCWLQRRQKRHRCAKQNPGVAASSVAHVADPRSGTRCAAQGAWRGPPTCLALSAFRVSMSLCSCSFSWMSSSLRVSRSWLLCFSRSSWVCSFSICPAQDPAQSHRQPGTVSHTQTPRPHVSPRGSWAR